MDIVLKGTEKDINALLKKERLWLVRHNVNVAEAKIKKSGNVAHFKKKEQSSEKK